MNNSKKYKQAIEPLKAVFFAGVVLSLCFVFPILRCSERIVFAQVDNKLNPNTASVYELAELPGLGPAKAQAIADYRQGNDTAFEKAGDLKKVKGIGEKTAEKIGQWLVFE